MIMSSKPYFVRLLPILASVVAACSSTPTATTPLAGTVTDTLGHKFVVGTSIVNGSLLDSKDPNVKPRSCIEGLGDDSFVLVYSNLLTIMATPVNSAGEHPVTTGNPARPVACTTAADCLAPDLVLMVDKAQQSYTCQDGVCRLPGQPLFTNNVITLCQADLPWPNDCPYMTEPKFAARLSEIATVCGTKFNCDKIPASCILPVALSDAGAPSVTPDASGPEADPTDAL